MKAITIEIVGEASIKENKVVVDYTELKELVNNHESLLENLKRLTKCMAYNLHGEIIDKAAYKHARYAIEQAEKE